ncbi:hypothetical protein KKF92_03170 [Patescibacteria group bacterium]|nr:hypothetical protein [Patescibacteria group bacterium]
MFKQLTDFGFQRNKKQALGFYLAYLLLIMLVGGVVAGVLFPSDVSTVEDGFAVGATIGAKVGPILVLAIAVLVLKGKNFFSKFNYIILSILAGLLSLFGGGLLGLIPIAYMTTKPKLQKRN